MALIEFALTGLKRETSNNGIASCNEDVLFSYNHGLNGFFRCDEALSNFICFQVDNANHFIPRGSEHHIKGGVNANDRYGVCELKNSLASTILDVPLPNSTIVGGREYIVACFICSDAIYFVGVADHRENNVARFTFPRADKTILIAGENVRSAKAEAAHTLHLLLLLQSFSLEFKIR